MTTQVRPATRRSDRIHPKFHSHGRAPLHGGRSKRDCLKILRALSTYIDNELPGEVCAEVRKHMVACPNCEVFVESLRQTIGLCKHLEPRPLSNALKSRIRRFVLQAAERSH